MKFIFIQYNIKYISLLYRYCIFILIQCIIKVLIRLFLFQNLLKMYLDKYETFRKSF